MLLPSVADGSWTIRTRLELQCRPNLRLRKIQEDDEKLPCAYPTNVAMRTHNMEEMTNAASPAGPWPTPSEVGAEFVPLDPRIMLRIKPVSS